MSTNVTDAMRLEAEAQLHFKKWGQQRKRARLRSIYDFVQSRHYGYIGVYEQVAGGLPDRFKFWMRCTNDAGDGKLPNGQWKNLDLGFRRLKIRWVRRLFKACTLPDRH